MRRVAGNTSAGLHHGVFIGEGPRRVGMAFDADCILVIRRPKLLPLERAVGIVAIRATHLTFIHLVVKCLGESGAHIFVTRETQEGLLHLQQIGLTRGLVNAVATQAAHSSFRVLGTLEIGVLARVAGEAGFIDLRCGEVLELPDLRDISTAVHVRFSRTMAALATDTLAVVFKSEARVRIGGEFLRGLFVARGAGVRADIIGRAYWLNFVGGPGQRLLGDRSTEPWSENGKSHQANPHARNDASHTHAPRRRLIVPDSARQKRSILTTCARRDIFHPCL